MESPVFSSIAVTTVYGTEDTAQFLEELVQSLRVGLHLQETPRPARPTVLSLDHFANPARSRVEDPALADSHSFSCIAEVTLHVRNLNRLPTQVKMPARLLFHRGEDELSTSRNHRHRLHG